MNRLNDNINKQYSKLIRISNFLDYVYGEKRQCFRKYLDSKDIKDLKDYRDYQTKIKKIQKIYKEAINYWSYLKRFKK